MIQTLAFPTHMQMQICLYLLDGSKWEDVADQFKRDGTTKLCKKSECANVIRG